MRINKLLNDYVVAMCRRYKRLVGGAARPGAIVLFLKLCGMGFTFAVQVLIARELGTWGAGLFNVALTLIVIISTIARMGLDDNLVRLVAALNVTNDLSRIKSSVANSAHAITLISILLAACVYLFAGPLALYVYHEPAMRLILETMSVVILPMSLAFLYGKSLQGMKKSTDAILIQAVLLPFVLTILLYLLLDYIDIIHLAICYLLAQLFVAAYGWYRWRRVMALTNGASTIQENNLLEQTRMSLPLLGVTLLAQLMQSMPLLAVASLSGMNEAGVFNAAFRIAGVMGLVTIITSITAAPVFAELYKKNDLGGLENAARRSAFLMTLLAAPGFIACILVPGWLMSLFGLEFIGGASVLMIMAIGQTINAVTSSVGILLSMTGNGHANLVSGIYSTIFCGVLSLVLIPIFGAIGAAMAYSMPLVVVNVMRIVYAKKRIGVCCLPGI